MSWVLSWTTAARDDLRRLDRQVAARVIARVERFAREGHGDVKKLKGSDEYRLRVGDWRVRFTMNTTTNILSVERVLPRSEAYR